MRPKVLLYHLDADTELGRALRAVLAEQKLPVLTVRDEQTGETAGRLAAANAAVHSASAPEHPPREAFMLLCDLGSRQLDRLLAAMRRAGTAVPYKAVLTEYNRNWTLAALIEAVVREHEALQNKA